jgi:hypothetical protein
MLPSDIIMNFVQQPAFGWLTPVLTLVGAVGVGILTALSVKWSDERKKAQEDRRRWDEELVPTVIDMLVLTDDIASTEKQLSKKKKAILAGNLPAELNRHLIHIRLLTNGHLADQAQEVVQQFFTERIAMHNFLVEEVKGGKSLDDITEIPGYSLSSTNSTAYHEARRYFLNLFHQLLVSVQVQKFTAESSVDWKAMVKLVEDYEKEQKRKDAEAKHRAPDEPIPATAVRERIN